MIKLTLDKVSVDRNSLIPRLNFDLTLNFQYQIEAPISITGRLFSSGGKLISTMTEMKVGRKIDFNLKYLPSLQIQKNYREKNYNNYHTRLISQNLSAIEINHIEELREAKKSKSVEFYLDVEIKYLQFPDTMQCRTNDNRAFTICYCEERRIPEISQEEWIKNFAPYLGIGEFVLLEFGKFQKFDLPDFWKELFGQLESNLKDMEERINKGDWKGVMFYSRKFYENTKIGDGKSGSKKFQEELEKVLLNNQHDKKGIQNFYDGVWKFFEFTSKYAHDKDKSGNIKPAPISEKEDAYFAYTMAVGLINLLGRKLANR